MAVILNASTSTGYVQTADTSGSIVMQSDGTTQFNITSTGAYGQIKSGTAVSPTTSTSVEFTNLPSWVKRITVMFQGVSTNSTGNPIIQLGTGATPTYTTSGYIGSAQVSTTSVLFTNGFGLSGSTAAASVFSGIATIANLSGNVWAFSYAGGYSNAAGNSIGGGSVSLGAALTAIRLYIDGTQQFDAGSINILYEG